MSTMILRVVAKGETEETDNFDMDDPSDLVAIKLTEEGQEVEIDRLSFDTGHKASKYLCEILRK